MKPTISFVLAILSFQLMGQNGYVKLYKNDSIIAGYVKHYKSALNGQLGIELWRNKRDKHPLRLPITSILEYAIKKDTFRILKNFRPFQEASTYFALVEAKLISRGKVNLFAIEDYQNPKRSSTYTGGGLIPELIDESMGNFTYIYVIENSSSGYLRALPSKRTRLMQVLLDFFPETYLNTYGALAEGITYKAIPSFVKLYNSK